MLRFDAIHRASKDELDWFERFQAQHRAFSRALYRFLRPSKVRIIKVKEVK